MSAIAPLATVGSKKAACRDGPLPATENLHKRRHLDTAASNQIHPASPRALQIGALAKSRQRSQRAKAAITPAGQPFVDRLSFWRSLADGAELDI